MNKFFKSFLLSLLFFQLLSPCLADFGSHFLLNNRMATALDSKDKKLSIRFTCLEDMNLLAVSFFCEQTQNPPSYLVSIRENKRGKPATIALASNNITPLAHSWVTVPINNLPLYAGRVYHMVIEFDALRDGIHPVGEIGPQAFASFAYTDILNPFNPQNEAFDDELDVLFFKNGKWKTLNRQPLYALHGSERKFQGNSYDNTGARPIHGNGTPGNPSDDHIQGVALHPHCGFAAKKLAVRIKKQGHPNSPLQFRIYAIDYTYHRTNLVGTGEAAKPEDVGASFQWVTFGAKEKQSLPAFPPECRYIIFQSDSGRAVSESPGCEDCYLLSDIGNSGGLPDASAMSFDGGAHLSRVVYSNDGWSTWIDDFERDANVAIISNPCPKFIPKPVSPIPTPAPLLWEVKP
jgi:hypothetical protein